MSCLQEFSEEVAYIFNVKSLPQVFRFNLTSLTVINNNGTSVELYFANLNTVLNITLWSATIIVFMTVVLIFFLGLYCCLCHCTHDNKSNPNQNSVSWKESGTLLKCFKAFTVLLIGFIILNSWGILVLEVEVKKRIVSSINGTEKFINFALRSQGNESTAFDEVEKWKNYFAIAWNYVYYYALVHLNILVLALIILMPIAGLCAGRQKHSTTSLTLLLLVILLLTWIGSLSASANWGILMYLSTLCHDLVQIGQGLNCDLYKLETEKAEEHNFCGKYLLEPLFALASYYSCLLVLLVVFQFFGIALCFCSARTYRMRVHKRNTAHMRETSTEENENQLTTNYFEDAQTVEYDGTGEQQLTDDEPPRYEDVCSPGTETHAL